MRPFVLLSLALCGLIAGSTADAQWFGRRSYGTCASGNCGGVSAYSAPAFTQPSYAPAPVVTSTPSTAYSAPRQSTYSSGENGQVITSDGNRLKSVGGVEVVSKAWADAQIAKAQDDAMSFAAIPSGCNCPDYTQQFKDLKAELAEIKRRLPYMDKQSKSDREFESLVAKQRAERAIVLGKVSGERVVQR